MKDSGLSRVSEGHLESVFDAFWDHQFEDDRTSVRRIVSELADLIMEVEAGDEA